MTPADYVKAPVKNATEAISQAKFTAGTTHAANAIPREWAGKFVKITVVGGDLSYFFGTSGSDEVDRTVAAAAGGASGATVGDFLADGGSDHIMLPPRPIQGDLYFVREASATAVVTIRLAG